MKRRHLGGRRALAAVALIASVSVLGLGGAAAAAPDSKGTDYWLMFTENFNPATLSLFVTSDVSTTGTMAIPGLGVSTAFTVTAGAVTTVSIPAGAEVSTLDTVETKGIHVTAQAEVTVYGLSQATTSTDAFLGLPTDVLGDEYITLGYRNSGVVQGSQFGIVATADATTVTITPSLALPGHPGGVPYTVTMNAGQTYQLRTTSAPGDLSGTVVTSDKPVAVFGGHLCANIPPTAVACDHVVEQLPSTDTWGKSFVTMPLATRVNGDTFRFLAAVDGTTVSINGTLAATLNRGEVHEQIVGGAAVIEASSPILVAQYSNGSSFDNVTSDPFMMLIPPNEQFLGDYTITTPATVFTTNFVNVVAPTAAVGSLTLDGAPIAPGSFTPIGASGFSGAQLSVIVGSHRLQGTLPFGVFAYGFASFDSYGYPGGASFSPVAVVTDVALDPKTATNLVNTEHCVSATVTDQDGGFLEGIRVDFGVTGANSVSGFAFTNASGVARFCYTGTNVGGDTIQASVGSITDIATKTWIEELRPDALTLTPETDTNVVGTEHCVTATVTDQNDDPFAGASVAFSVTGPNTASGFASTGADGQAEFCYTGTNLGTDAIVASVGALTDNAAKTWIPEPARATTLVLTPETATNVVNTEHCVLATVTDQRGDPFAGASVAFTVTGANTASSSAATGQNGQAPFCYTGSNVGGDSITASAGALTDTASKTWTPEPSVGRAVFLIVDEESFGKGNRFANRVGDTVTINTGQSGDEGWFAPNCIPRKWLGGSSNACLEGAERETAIDNYIGKNGRAAVPKESRLDKVPAVMPLRALGLTSLVGEEACAVAYDSDAGVNYDNGRFPFTDANLQGKTRGVVAFRVEAVKTQRGSSSTLPRVTLTILDSSVCTDWVLFNAPVPRSSSEPNDTRADKPAGTGGKGYRQLRTRPEKDLFY